MRGFLSALGCLIFLIVSQSSDARTVNASSVVQTKTPYLILEFPKYNPGNMDKLISELNSHPQKIQSVLFFADTHRMTIYYFDTIQLDDVLQIVSAYGMDFNKISGT